MQIWDAQKQTDPTDLDPQRWWNPTLLRVWTQARTDDAFSCMHNKKPVLRIGIRMRIWIRRIHMFLGLTGPHSDLLVRDTDPDSATAPDHSIIKQHSKKNINSYCFGTSLWLVIVEICNTEKIIKENWPEVLRHGESVLSDHQDPLEAVALRRYVVKGRAEQLKRGLGLHHIFQINWYMSLQCCGSVTFWYGSESGSPSSGPYLCLTDPHADPGGPKQWQKVIKTSQNSRNQGFSLLICLMMGGYGSGSGSWSELVTNGSGCGSGRPKNIRILQIQIRIHNTAYQNYLWESKWSTVLYSRLPQYGQ